MEKTYKIDVCCPNCAAKMEAATKQVAGVSDAAISFVAQKLKVTFAEGAYIVTMDQTCAKVIGMLLEIDNQDTSADYTLIALGLMEADSTGAYPVYRYVRDNPRTELNLK